MLTRLKVNGFKNLVNVDIQFGPFTCIAGANGVGKSNLFDAIKFLSDLASKSLLEAAQAVRDDGGQTSDVRSLFHRVGNDYDDEMSFEAEFIVSKTAIDDLGQQAKAGITFLRYSLIIGHRQTNSMATTEGLEIRREDLQHINLGDANKNLRFDHSVVWRKSAVSGRRTAPFLSTREDDGARIIELHQDGGPGRTMSLSASSLPRTVLSTANAAETPTMLIARREMQSWRLLQLEPSALRKPDHFTDPPRVGSDGAHMAATLYSLAEGASYGVDGEVMDASSVYSQVVNRLSELIQDVRSVQVDRDDTRRLLTLQVVDRDGTTHPAQALSDGTLRFLALAIIGADTSQRGLICLEEPENGIHPERIRAMLALLQDIAVDANEAVSDDNPLRQVIINTHSPAVVAEIPADALLVAEHKEAVEHGRRFKIVSFSCLSSTWRANNGETEVVSKGKLLAYLNPVIPNSSVDLEENGHKASHTKQRVVDRKDIQQLTFQYGAD